MSRAAKITFVASVALSGFTLWGVHFMQVAEREAMYQGVLRDDERQRKRREQMAREAEFEEQKRRRAYLESVQSVSEPQGPRPELPRGGVGDGSGEGIRFEGCKTC